MSKVVGAIGLASVGAAATVGGVYLSRMNRFDSTLPKVIAEFEKEENLEGCVAGLFPELKKISTEGSSGSGTDSSTEVNSNFFGSNKQNTEGCLVINGDKKEFGADTNKKGSGNFRFLWAVKNGEADASKGFVVFATATPDSSSKKFKGNGNLYSLEKTSGKGTLKQKLSVTDKEADPSTDKFPTPKTSLSLPKYWGFLSNISDDMGKVCGSSDCKEQDPKETKFEGYGTWKGGTTSGTTNNDKLGDWTEKMCDIWKDVAGEEKGKMAEVVKDISGTGTERVWYGIDKQNTTTTLGK